MSAQTPTGPEEVCSALQELVVLALKVRPSWDEPKLWEALAACQTAGWSWPRILRYTVNMLTVADATPKAIKDAAEVPLSGGQRRHG